MLDVFNIPRPQGCDIQIFYGSGVTNNGQKSWVKPRGVSHVYMMLVGAGGVGDGANGGGSGAVTVWYGAAQNVPSSLVVSVPATANATATKVAARFSNTPSFPSGVSTGLLLQAAAASNNSPGAAMSANAFTASGFFQSIDGQAGGSTNVIASTTTFLSAGGGASTQASNYGYSLGGAAGANRTGFLLLQPIIVGAGGMNTAQGGPGCGGGVNGSGGAGFCLIASW